jgi:hypothetical protein
MHAQHAKQFGFYENHTTRALLKTMRGMTAGATFISSSG